MSELSQNPFKAINGWHWVDERNSSHGPYKTQLAAVRAMLDYFDPPGLLVRLARWLTERS